MVTEIPWQISASEWTFGAHADLGEVLHVIGAAGLTAIELEGRIGREPAAVARSVRDTNLTVSSICGTFTSSLDLSSPERSVRRAAIGYALNCVELAVATGAPTVVVVPSALGRVVPVDDWDAHWKRSVRSMREVADQVDSSGVRLAIEPLNGYETDLVTTVAAANAFVEEVGSPAVTMMVDIFHVNLEERAIASAFAEAADLALVHLSDSNRRVPGAGHLDLAPVLEVLERRDYRGALVFETLDPSVRMFDASTYDIPPGARIAELQAARDWVCEALPRRGAAG